MIQLILAVSSANNGIGKNNKLLWNIPEDLQNFKNATSGGIVVMGRATWNSLPVTNRPLPERLNVVISKQITEHNYKHENGPLFFQNPHPAIQYLEEVHPTKHIFIIGGSVLASSLLDVIQRAIITIVHDKSNEADCFFDYASLDKLFPIKTKVFEGVVPATGNSYERFAYSLK